MVRHFAAVRREVIQTFGQRGLQVSETTDIGIRHFRQLRHVVGEGGLLNVEGFVRTPAWQHFDIKRGVFRDNGMMLQGVNRIVGGAHHLHVHLLHDAARGEVILRQQRVAAIPDFIRGRWGKQLAGDAKRTAELKMGPVVERVADGVRNGRRPGVKLLAVGRIAGTQALSHAVGAHGTPFIVVTLQPDVIQVFEAIIFGNLLRR